jgi:D-alanyl-D-alanine carboxypeptidase (penicillin-binding protein 5/6)
MRELLWRHKVALTAVVVLVLLVLTSYVQLQRTPPVVAITEVLPDRLRESDAALALPWPQKGQSAVSVQGVGLVGHARDDRPRPIASLVKVMTAYVVLKDHPLKPGERGPGVEVRTADIDLYRQQRANVESVIEVRAGDTITELELLQGLLVPSGNNYAYMLAAWNSGSVEAFVERMNAEAASLGMTSTRYADPSGLSPATVSTARDQLKLAEAAMADPVFAGIVALKQVTLPAAGVQYNVNSLLVRDDLVGIKTGWTEEAGA